jgi:hypothetical protein
MSDTAPTADTTGTGTTKLTAEEISAENCPAELQDLGKRIAVHLEKAARCTEQAKNHRLSAGQFLAQAKDACDEGGFEAFRARFCPKLGKSRAYELLAIASGKKSVEESRAENAERVRKFRDNQKAADVSVTVTENRPALGTAVQPTAEPAKPSTPTEETEPTVEEAEAEVARLKALRAKINTNRDNETKIDPKISADALSEFRAACAACLHKMNDEDLQTAIDHFAEAVEFPAIELKPELRSMQADLKVAKAEITALKRKLAGKLPPNESRAARWSRLASEAVANVEELISYQSEFEEARERQPDSLQDGPFAQKCEEVCCIDLESARETLQEAENADLPLGFGRD